MRKIHKFADGTKCVLNTKLDAELYAAPVNPPNTNSNFLTGVDLFAKKTKDHGYVFYTYSWSLWQGSSPSIEILSHEEAVSFCDDRCGDYFNFPDKADLKMLHKFDIDLLKDDA